MKNVKATKWQQASRILLLCLVLAAAVFYRDSLTEIFREIRQADPAAVFISILLAMAAYLVEGLTIACMAGAVTPSSFILPPSEKLPAADPAGRPDAAVPRQQNCGRFPVGQGIRITFLCEFYRMVTLGNGSGVAEIHYLHKSGIEAGSAAVLTMIQYMLKRTAVMVLGIFGFAVLYGNGDAGEICREYALFMTAGCLGTAGVIAVFTALSLSSRIASWTVRLLDLLSRKLPSWEKRFAKWKGQIRLLNRSGKEVLRQKRRILCALFLQSVKMLLFYSIPASLLSGNIRLPFAESTLLMAMAYLLSGIIPAPSGAGALEFVFLLFFSRFTDSAGALSAVLLFRFATWVLPFGIGAGIMVREQKRAPAGGGRPQENL